MISAAEFLKWCAVFGITPGGGGGGGGKVYGAQVATTGNLNATYNNGASGVGATLTNAGANAALVIDSVSLSLGNIVLVKDQTSAVQNGLYTVTTVGSGSIAWVLTRATYYDSPIEILPGDLITITSGTVNANSSRLQYSTVVTVGVSSILYNLFTANPASFLRVANNLSDVANNNTSVNNLQIGRGFEFQGTVGASTVTLTNPCPRVVVLSPASGNVTLKLPVMNSTTPGSKSLAAGETVLVRNATLDDSQVIIQFQDGTPVGISNLHQDQWVILEVRSNATANGLIEFQRNGTATYANSSDPTKLSVASLDNPTSAYLGKIPFYTDANGTLGVTGATYNTGTGLITIPNLSYPIRAIPITVDTVVNPASDLCTFFQVTTASVNITAQVIGNYQTSFQFWIKNSSGGNITFTPNGADNIDGASSLTIAPLEAVQIAKSLTANTWEVISNYNTASASGYLLALNNLSDVSNTNTSVNNLQLPRGFGFHGTSGVATVTLTNPCPKTIVMAPDGGDVTLVMPVMNSTTPGSKSLAAGEDIFIRNASLDGSQVIILLQDGSTPLGITNLFQDQWAILEVQSNATANGLWQYQKNGTATYADASDTSKTSVASLDNPSVAYNGKIPVYTDDNGTLGNTGVAPPSLDGQLIIGKTGDVPQVANLTAGTGITITEGPGSITISASGGGVNVVNVTTATQALAVDTKYIINYSGGICTLTLPATFALGDEIEILGSSVDGWTIVQNSGQNIRVGSVVTTTTTGSLSSANRYDCVKLEGLVANNTMTVTSAQTVNFGVT